MRKGKMMMPRFLARILLIASMALVGRSPEARAQTPPPAQDQSPPPDGGQQRRQFRGNFVGGKIQSISATEIKLAGPDGSTVTVALNSKTQFRIEQQPAKLEDFKVGAFVFVRGNKTGDYTWDAELVAIRTGPPGTMAGGPGMAGNIVAGTVKTIEGTRITILRLDGTTQTIEADENTSLQKHRESITLADIHPGDAVAVRGESKDGAFLPKTVNVLDPAQLERMKQFINWGGGLSPGVPPPAEKKPDAKPQGTP
jgi:uncharacterized protein DUF5666